MPKGVDWGTQGENRWEIEEKMLCFILCCFVLQGFSSGRMNLALNRINRRQEVQGLSSRVQEMIFNWGIRKTSCSLSSLLWHQLMLSYRVSVSFSNISTCFLVTAITYVCAVKSRKGWLFAMSTEAIARWILLQGSWCMPSVLCPGHVHGWSNCISAPGRGNLLSMPGTDRCPHPQASAPGR